MSIIGYLNRDDSAEPEPKPSPKAKPTAKPKTKPKGAELPPEIEPDQQVEPEAAEAIAANDEHGNPEHRAMVRSTIAELLPDPDDVGLHNMDDPDVAEWFDIAVEVDTRAALAWRQYVVAYDALRGLAGVA